MKYPPKQYESLVQSLPVVLDYFKIDNKETALEVGNLHNLHFTIYTNKNYPENNANVKRVNGERLLALDNSFELYPNNCNDTQIETAMKAAIKQIFH